MTTNDTLLSVLYTSNARTPFDDDALAELLAHSRDANARNELTGMLLYRGGRFVQVLEGPPERVRDLLAVIAADERHTAMRVLIEQPIERREFSDWSMGYQPMGVTTEPAPEGFRDTFDDLEQSGDPSATLRAARELSLWFRVRERQARPDAR